VATVLIIGASRGIGLETVKAALKAGHSVRALARSARRIRVDHPKLEKMAGDALEMATVKRALTGADAIIQSLGVSVGPEIILKPTRLFSKATRVLVTAMEEAQVKRLICVTGFGAGDSRGHDQLVDLMLGQVLARAQFGIRLPHRHLPLWRLPLWWDLLTEKRNNGSHAHAFRSCFVVAARSLR